jgi:hypothetical protein
MVHFFVIFICKVVNHEIAINICSRNNRHYLQYCSNILQKCKEYTLFEDNSFRKKNYAEEKKHLKYITYALNMQ